MICVIILFVFEVCLSVHAVVSDTESGIIVERISRRQNNDIYLFINSSTTGTNCGDKNTYLISEDQCVKDQELFKGNLIYIVPIDTLTIITIQDAGMLLFQLVLYILLP